MKNSGLNLLKIISAVCVLVYHTINTFFDIEQFDGLKKCFVSAFFWGSGRISVAVFIIISSWYLCEKKQFINRIIYLWLSTLLYSTIVGLVFISDNYSFFIKQLFPITNNVSWFISTYIFVLILAPFMNEILNRYDIKYLLITFGLIFGVVKMVYPNSRLWISDIDIYIYIYMLTGFIKLQTKFRPKMIPCIIVFLLSYLLEILWFTYFDTVSHFFSIIPIMGYSKWMFFQNFQYLLPLLTAYSLFGIFININITSVKLTRFIDYLSGGLFGVYVCLSMDGPNGHLWWGEFFNISKYNLVKTYCCIIIIFILTDFLDHFRLIIVKYIMSFNAFKRMINKAELLYCPSND
ncbi:hypothetical protein BXO88_01325 [Oribacterium sp. C9]|nr:hypothetical protein BXO88_01325 [Oribacterium sp. C9]